MITAVIKGPLPVDQFAGSVPYPEGCGTLCTSVASGVDQVPSTTLRHVKSLSR
jgi:hypothetical protein